MRAISRHVTTALGLACVLIALALPHVVQAVPASSTPQRVATARARIGAMQKELSVTLAAYDGASSRLRSTRVAIAANRRKLAELKKSTAIGQRHLAAEAVFLYRTNGNGFTEALLSAGSVEQFSTRLFSLARVASRDAALLKQMRADRIEAQKLAVMLADREAREVALVLDVSGRRRTAQSALDAQQRYADSLSAAVAKALQSEQSSAGSGSGATPAPSSSDSHAVARAKVEGRSGTYAVLVGDPKSYRPTDVTFDGKATWYGNVRPNMKTASGRSFDERDFTCAHKTLPFGTRVAVNFRGRKVIVVVTDRGPYGRGRVIDLTKHAAEVIGLKSAGVGAVHCEVVKPN